MVAGEPTGLRYLTTIRHKLMLSARNRPMIEHALNILIDAGINGTRLFVSHGTDYVCHALQTDVMRYTTHVLHPAGSVLNGCSTFVRSPVAIPRIPPTRLD